MNENMRLTDHFKEWLGAYLDGELSPERSAWVEAHLADCPECRAELESLASLSSLLHSGDDLLDAALPLGIAPGQAARIPAGAAPVRSSRRFANALRYLPLAFFAGWAFVQSVLLVTGGLRIIQALVPGAQEGLLGRLFPDPSGSFDLLAAICGLLPGNAICELLEGIPQLPLVGGVGLFSLLMTAFSAALFLSWLAGLWVHHRSQAAEYQSK